MSADVLHRAAELMREEWHLIGGRLATDPDYLFHHAIAAWLESVFTDATDEDDSEFHHAVTVARAYLGEAS